ncbi:MAG: ribosome maturation factor RimP [Clostridia bacterium]|nr:ribosome maturation factor RimP [Clostridia bacterium]
MAKKRVEDAVTELVKPITDQHSFELVDVEFIKEGANWYLRIYIDKPKGITIDDCQVVSEELSEKLDKEDPIEQSYFLEVSSPGLERPLKKDRDFEKYKGEVVEVKLFEALDGRKIFEGELLGLIDDRIVVKPEKGSEMAFDRDKVALVRRVIKF